jgi:hypothetical protein
MVKMGCSRREDGDNHILWGFVNIPQGQFALDSQQHVIKFTSCLPMVGGSLRVLRLPPPLKLVAMI